MDLSSVHIANAVLHMVRELVLLVVALQTLRRK